MTKTVVRGMLAGLAALAACAGWCAQEPIVTINQADFADRVYACWLGKSIGGTLGMPFEGKREARALTFFDPVPDKPAANDDLDLQLLWLKAVQERGTRVDARDLGDYWLKYVPVDWNEYGVGKANMRDGFLPPVSGHFRNAKWRDSNGAWIRSEIWACLAPGVPSLAARYAWQDACVDHGTSEGTYAEMFTAAIESAAFVERDRGRLIEIGLSYIPPGCKVATSVKAAVDAWARGLGFSEAREKVIQSSESTGWFMAPRNVGFVILGWLYGEGDFGKSICAAVNCGDDTDCTGATLGSILGIIHGSKFIPDRWRKPVGEGIQHIAIAGVETPASLSELTDQTVAAAKKVLAATGAPVAISASAPTDLSRKCELALTDRKVAQGLWSRSPLKLVYEAAKVRATFDYRSDPEIRAGQSRRVTLALENLSDRKVQLSVRWDVGAPLTAEPGAIRLILGPRMRASMPCVIRHNALMEADRVVRGTVTVSPGAGEEEIAIPIAFLCRR